MNIKDKLRHLVVYKDDPGLIDLFMPDALNGDIDALYALGLIYAEGRGCTIDLLKSYKWLTLAIEGGDLDARSLRNVVLNNMSQEELASIHS